MMIRVLALYFVLTSPILVASAQTPPPPESRTLTATRPELDKFAKAFAVPAKLTGKIARWEIGACPVSAGQSPAMTAFLTARDRAIAAAAAAPVNASASCTPNIQIIFTTAPQDLLDNIRKNDPDSLGYAESSAEREKLATVSHVIQAWYATETVDLDGKRQVDRGRRRPGSGSGLGMISTGGLNRDPLYLPDATSARVTVNHINDGARSAFTSLMGDQIIGYGSWAWAEQSASPGRSPVYRYHFTRRPPGAPALSLFPLAAPGVYHFAEILYVFNHLDLRPEWGWTQADHRLAQTMSAYWVQFAKTGNPNANGLARWEPFVPGGTGQVMELGERIGMQPEPNRARFEFLHRQSNRLAPR